MDCPLETCMARDPKGIYRRAREGRAETVPGLQTAYETPVKPEVVVQGDLEASEDAASRILKKLAEMGYV